MTSMTTWICIAAGFETLREQGVVHGPRSPGTPPKMLSKTMIILRTTSLQAVVTLIPTAQDTIPASEISLKTFSRMMTLQATSMSAGMALVFLVQGLPLSANPSSMMRTTELEQ